MCSSCKRVKKQKKTIRKKPEDSHVNGIFSSRVVRSSRYFRFALFARVGPDFADVSLRAEATDSRRFNRPSTPSAVGSNHYESKTISRFRGAVRIVGGEVHADRKRLFRRFCRCPRRLLRDETSGVRKFQKSTNRMILSIIIFRIRERIRGRLRRLGWWGGSSSRHTYPPSPPPPEPPPDRIVFDRNGRLKNVYSVFCRADVSATRR